MEKKSKPLPLNLKNCLASFDITHMWTDDLKPARVLREDDQEGKATLIFVTDSPEMIEFLKLNGVSGKQRTVESQRGRDEAISQGRI